MDRQLVSSASPYEGPVGFSRAVRAGNLVFVAGTIGADAEGNPVSPDPHEQAVAALRRIEAALKEAGAELRHVVRTRIYVTDITQWEAIGRAHGEFFGSIRPATAMIEVSRFIAPGFVVEIEADAVID